MNALTVFGYKSVLMFIIGSFWAPLFAYEVTVDNKTLREVEVRVNMAAAIKSRKHSDWHKLEQGESFSYNTGALLVKGVEARLAGADENILSESTDPAMAIRPEYKILSTVTPNKAGGSKELFHLLRMPNIPLSRPGGIVSDSKFISFPELTQQFCRDEGDSSWTYDQYHFVTAHNAFTSAHYGYKLDPQQDLTLTDQLKSGIRGFMLDTYLYDGKVVIQHSSDFDKLLKLGKSPTPFKKRMDEIANFMKEHKQVIVTMILEDYVGKSVKLLDNDLSSYEKLILKPADWDPLVKGSWPTLGWMRDQGKRMIIFKSSPARSEYAFRDEWKYHAENQYSATDKKTCATERPDSKDEALTRKKIPLVLVINYFSSFNALDYKTTTIGYKDSLKNVLDYVKGHGLDGNYKGVNPNSIAVDFAEWGDALDLVHEWNEAKCK